MLSTLSNLVQVFPHQKLYDWQLRVAENDHRKKSNRALENEEWNEVEWSQCNTPLLQDQKHGFASSSLNTMVTHRWYLKRSMTNAGCITTSKDELILWQGNSLKGVNIAWMLSVYLPIHSFILVVGQRNLTEMWTHSDLVVPYHSISFLLTGSLILIHNSSRRRSKIHFSSQ